MQTHARRRDAPPSRQAARSSSMPSTAPDEYTANRATLRTTPQAASGSRERFVHGFRRRRSARDMEARRGCKGRRLSFTDT